MSGAISYMHEASGLQPQQLEGFFVGWPEPPSPERHLEILKGSAEVVLALDRDRVVGFATAVGDGVVCAYVPLLEVLPAYQGRGIGTELMRRMLARLGHLYMVDLACDEELVPFYERLGLRRHVGMGVRNREALRGR